MGQLDSSAKIKWSGVAPPDTPRIPQNFLSGLFFRNVFALSTDDFIVAACYRDDGNAAPGHSLVFRVRQKGMNNLSSYGFRFPTPIKSTALKSSGDPGAKLAPLKIYPNSATGFIRFDWPPLYGNADEATILNDQGTAVWKGRINKSAIPTTGISMLGSGLYVLVIRDGKCQSNLARFTRF